MVQKAGEVLQVQRSVIDHFDEQDNLNTFKIRLDDLDSTKYPEFTFNSKHNLVYGDLVGLLSKQTDADEYTMQLIWQQIFRVAQSVKFTPLITFSDFEEFKRDQSKQVSHVLDYLTKIAGMTNKSLLQIIDSVQPVVTQIALDHSNFDLASFKSTLQEQLLNHLNQPNKAVGKLQASEMGAKETSKIESFVKRVIVYHPLDQPVFKRTDGVDVDQAAKHQDIVKSLQALEPQQCSLEEYFRYQPQTHEQFRQIYRDAKDKVMEIGELEMEIVGEQGEDYNGDMMSVLEFHNVNVAIKFLSKSWVHADVRRYLIDFVNYYEE